MSISSFVENWDTSLARFQETLQEQGLERHTIACYTVDVRGFAAWLQEHRLQNSALTTCDSGDVEAYLDYRQRELAHSPASINRSLQGLRKFASFLKTSGLREQLLTAGVKMLPTEDLSTPSVLSPEEEQAVRQLARSDANPTARRDQAIIALMLGAGLRVSETAQLQRHEAENAIATTTLHISAQGKRPGRTIPVSPEVLAALNVYLAEAQPSHQGYLFPSRDGTRLSVRSLQRLIQQLGRRAGLEINAQTLRNTYAVRQWQETGDIDGLARNLGLKRYEGLLRYIMSSL